MLLFAALTLTILPAAAVLVWIRMREKDGTSPSVSLPGALAVGAVSVVVALLIGALVSPLGDLMSPRGAIWFDAFVIAGLVEEGVKLGAIAILAAIVARRSGALSHKELVHRGAVIGIGFSVLENVYYAFAVPSALLLRAVTAVPLHFGTSAIAASRLYAAGRRHRSIPGDPLVIPVLLHGTYDRVANLEGPAAYAALAVPVATLAVAVLLYRASAEEITENDPL